MDDLKIFKEISSFYIKIFCAISLVVQKLIKLIKYII